MNITRDKVTATLLGVTIGDRLGVPAETLTREQIVERYERITSYVRPDGHKWFDGCEAGTASDDTQHSNLVAESLTVHQGIDLDDIAKRSAVAMNMSALGWGRTTMKAIRRIREGAHWSESGVSDNPQDGKGNGVIMKAAPVALYLEAAFGFTDALSEEVLQNIFNFTCMTHRTRIAVVATFAHIAGLRYCLRTAPTTFQGRAFAEEVRVGALLGAELWDAKFGKSADGDDLFSRLALLRDLPWRQRDVVNAADIFGGCSSYIGESLSVSCAFFIRNPSSVEAMYDAVNAGGDTDTNTSLVGALLGALNGVNIFPKHLLDFPGKEYTLDLASRFCDVFNIAT